MVSDYLKRRKQILKIVGSGRLGISDFQNLVLGALLAFNSAIAPQGRTFPVASLLPKERPSLTIAIHVRF